MEVLMLILAKKIKEMRLTFDYSQAKVARAISMSPQSYNRYENGERKPNLELIFKLAKLYEVSVLHFLATAPTKKLTPEINFNSQVELKEMTENPTEYSLANAAFHFESLFLKTAESFRKFKAVQKAHIRDLKSQKKKYFESKEVEKLRKEYLALREKIVYYNENITLLLKSKMLYLSSSSKDPVIKF